MLTHGPKHTIMSTDARAMFFVFGFCVAVRIEFRRLAQQRATIPDCVKLLLVRDYVDVYRCSLHQATAQLLTPLHTSVHTAFDISMETFVETLEHGRASREDNILVQPTAGIYGTALNHIVNHLGQRHQEIRGDDLRIKKDFRAQKNVRSQCQLRTACQ